MRAEPRIIVKRNDVFVDTVLRGLLYNVRGAINLLDAGDDSARLRRLREIEAILQEELKWSDTP